MLAAYFDKNERAAYFNGESLESMILQCTNILLFINLILKFRCTYCSDYYWNTIELTHHRNLHSDVEYKCEKCEQIFHNRDSMYSHCVLQHSKRGQKNPDDEFICDLCSKKFRTKSGVRAHLLVHMSKIS